MGTWSTKLYGNDTTSDVRDTYIEYLRKTANDEDAYRMTYDEYNELIGTDEEALFWFALADTQWEYGRLMEAVKDKALYFISEFLNTISEQLSKKQIAIWRNVLENLSLQLTSQMPPYRKILTPRIFVRNPWNVGDIYAYRFHSQKSQKCDLYGKYIVLQKIGNALSYDDLTFSVIQIFNEIYSSCPTLGDINGVNILPLVCPPNIGGTPSNINDYIPSFDWFTKAIMILDKPSSYPKKHLSFLGNLRLPDKIYYGNDCQDIFWEETGMEDWIIDYYSAWNNHNKNA